MYIKCKATNNIKVTENSETLGRRKVFEQCYLKLILDY